MMRITHALTSILICLQLFHVSEATVTQCLVCDSNEYGCAEGSPAYARNCTVESEACFTSVTNGVLLRGCLSRLAGIEQQLDCTEKEGSTCISCFENGCNTVSWVRCAHCNNAGAEPCTIQHRVQFCPQFRAADRCYEIFEGGAVSVFRPISKGCESSLDLGGVSCGEIDNCRIIGSNSIMCGTVAAQTLTMQCLVCSSDDESYEECTRGTSPAQDCPQVDDVCFSRVKGNTLERNCLSTLSTEKQNICSGSDRSCITCTEPGCNTHHLLKCFQCKKSVNIECIDIAVSGTLESYFCPQFLPDARCFERIVGPELERGCTSESTAICTGNNRCLLCAEDGCNVESETHLDNVAKCFRCTSTDGDNEACDEVILGAEECDQLEDECFARVQGGTLQRNCLSTLSQEDQQKCQEREDTSCYGCKDHGCNQFPRIRCYRCSSLEDPRCIDPVDRDLDLTFCDSYKPDDRCYARIVDNHIERGCEGDLEDEVHDVCAGNAMCYGCYRSGCNGVDEDTLRNMARCIICSTDQDGEECGRAAFEAELCDEIDDVCFTRVQDEHLQRGCLSTLDIEEQNNCRDERKGSCVTCQSPSCNNQNWLKCLSCKKSESSKCTDSSSDLASYCSIYDEQATCFARIMGTDLERGCSVDVTSTDDVCKNTVACETCATDNCNSQTEESLLSWSKCIQCTSKDTDSDCNEHLPEATRCAEENDKCFTRVRDGILTRNCLSSLEHNEKEICINLTDLSCTVCEEPGCNEKRWTKCHQCDSTVSQGCADEQTENSAQFCKFYDPVEKCYTKVDLNNRLTRGCLSDVGTEDELCVEGETCVVCGGDSCNQLPESSLAPIICQQCTSADKDCVLGTVDSKPCPEKGDQCYTALNYDNILERGCLSMASGEMIAKCNNEMDPSCIVCSENSCNQHRWPQCYRCQSSDQNDHCSQRPGPDIFAFCPSYRDHTICYAAIEDGTLTRDCVDGQEDICEHRNRCVACQEEGCNDIPRDELDVVQTCYQCRSNVENCEHMQQPVQECSERNDQCFTRVDAEFNLHRGCVSDLDLNDCLQEDSCLICSEKNCNTAKWAKCFQCSNDTSDYCTTKQTDNEEVKYCRRYEEDGECYAKFEQGIFSRGCTSELGDRPCEDPQHCVPCTGDGCNRDSLKEYFNPAFCLQCHSDMHSGCIDGTAPAIACKDPDDLCFYRRASTKAIQRGCLSELSDVDEKRCRSDTSTNCYTCDDRGCNTADWRRCYMCSSLVHESCNDNQTEQNSTFLEFCTKIDDDCFADNNKGVMNRGCGTQYCGEREICIECTTDACNGQAESELQPSQCLVCDSNNPFCANGTSYRTSCRHLNEPCYSMVREDGVLERGCFSELIEPYKSMCMNERNRSCIACNGNACNRDHWQQCVQCRSSLVDHYCSREKSPLESHFCPRFEPNDRCYAKDVHGLVLRGCQSDYDSMDDPCKGSHEENCYTCVSDHCNLQSLNGVDRVLQQDVLLILAIAIYKGLLTLF